MPTGKVRERSGWCPGGLLARPVAVLVGSSLLCGLRDGLT